MTDHDTANGSSAQQPNGANGQVVKTGQEMQEHLRKQDKIKGVFSSQVIQKVGTGTTSRKTVKKTYWFVDEAEENVIEIQPLNVNYVPSGPKRRIPKEDFLEKFAPEPEFYISTVFPRMQELSKSVEKGEEHREKGEVFSAELEFGHALNIDEDNVRANFGLGLTYLDRGESSKSEDIFQRLVKLEAAFEPEHKHLFNEFGINLRKNKMFDQAVQYYERALNLQESDENLHYNIARAYFEKRKYDKVIEHLIRSIAMNPQLEEAKKFLQFMQDKNYVTADDVRAAANKVKTQAREGAQPQAPAEEEQPAPADEDGESSGELNVDL